MKICIIAPSLDPQKNVSGISTVVSTIMAHGHNEYVHYTFGAVDGDKKNLKWLYRMLKSFYRYNRFLKYHKPNLVHMNIPCDTKGILRESIILAISKKNKKHVLAHLHGGEYLMRKPRNTVLNYLLRRILSNSDKVVVLSAVEKASLQQLYNYSAAEILYNSVDTKNIPFKIVEKPAGNKLQLLFLGRLHESKGLQDMVKAFSQLYVEEPFRFMLCGAGPLEEYAVKEFTDIMGDDFSFNGIVSGEEKTNIILSSDVFILPSRYGEGLPMALLETMSAGIVPVTTDDASIKYVVKHNQNGIIVDKCKPEDMYRKLKDLFDHPGKLQELSINARKTIVEHFDVNQMIAKLEKIYSEISEH
jgi:glycosyltransferase involved in cell wall biosynthesis